MRRKKLILPHHSKALGCLRGLLKKKERKEGPPRQNLAASFSKNNRHLKASGQTCLPLPTRALGKNGCCAKVAPRTRRKARAAVCSSASSREVGYPRRPPLSVVFPSADNDPPTPRKQCWAETLLCDRHDAAGSEPGILEVTHIGHCRRKQDATTLQKPLCKATESVRTTGYENLSRESTAGTVHEKEIIPSLSRSSRRSPLEGKQQLSGAQ